MRLSIACLLLQFGLQWNLKTLGGNVTAGLGRTSKEHSVDAGANSLSAGAVFLYSDSAFGPSSCSWCQGLVRANRKARLEPLSTKWGFPGQGCQIAPWKFQPKVEWNITIPWLLHGLLMARNLPSFLSLSLLNSLQIYLSITLMTITNLLNSD